MKFATFFTTLVASATAADNKAPVISLNLVGATYENTGTEFRAYLHGSYLASPGSGTPGGHPNSETNSFADECEVLSNGPTGTEICEEPTAEALDHHDGDVSVTKTYHTVLTSEPGSYKSAADDSNALGCTATDADCLVCSSGDSTCLDNFAKRAEYVIQYDAVDDDNNDAETVTFALIVRDRKAPYCENAQNTPNCSPGTLSSDYHYIEFGNTCGAEVISPTAANMDTVDGCSQTVELCNQLNWAAGGSHLTPSSFYWASSGSQTYQDAYDGAMSGISTLQDAGLTEITGSELLIPSSEYTDLSAAKTIKYEYDVNDYAGVFGRSNVNNHFRERGTLQLVDTTIPEIVNVQVYTSVECGYVPPDTVSAVYEDCYDSWNTVDSTWTLNDVSITDASESSTSHDGTLWSVRKTWRAGGVDESGSPILQSTGYNKALNDPNTRDMVDGAFDSSAHSDFSLYFNVDDHFGNPALEVSKDIQVLDSLAPTLYITQVQKMAATNTDGHNCLAETGDGFNAAGDGATSPNTDITEKHCANAESKTHTDGEVYSFYEAGDLESTQHVTDPGFSAMASETEIQHSAGYDADYSFITTLMAETDGYRCEDGCWADPTTTVQWVSNDCNGAAGNQFDMKVTGDYFLHYHCIDGSGWETTACRTFHNVDKTRPVITVLQQANVASGHFILEATKDSNYVDEGATCSDIVDGTISSSVKVSGDLVDMASPGNYVIKYNCKDDAENEALEAYRTVEVVDRTCPTCSMPSPGGDTVTVEASFPYSDVSVDCTDNIDGLIHSADVSTAPTGTAYAGDLDGIDVETVDLDGYVVTYYATDVAGNSFLNCYENPPAEGPITSETSQDTRIYRTVVVTDTLIPTVEITYKTSTLNDRGTNPEVIMNDGFLDYMAENRLSANGWVIGAVASAVSGVALLGYAATRRASVATSVPV